MCSHLLLHLHQFMTFEHASLHVGIKFFFFYQNKKTHPLLQASHHMISENIALTVHKPCNNWTPLAVVPSQSSQVKFCSAYVRLCLPYPCRLAQFEPNWPCWSIASTKHQLTMAIKHAMSKQTRHSHTSQRSFLLVIPSFPNNGCDHYFTLLPLAVQCSRPTSLMWCKSM